MTQILEYLIFKNNYIDVAGIIKTKPEQGVIITCGSRNVNIKPSAYLVPCGDAYAYRRIAL